LYFRFSGEDHIDGVLIEARIPLANQSVNWSKYSRPWDVKFDHPTLGIGQILVSNLPTRLPEVLSIDPNDKFHDYAPKHVPENLNYAHSEIQVYKGGVLAAKVNNSNVKTAYRSIIRKKAVILLKPLV
jgi:hypothetical protein